MSASLVGFRFPPEVILGAARWYLRYGRSYRDVEELLAERGVGVDPNKRREADTARVSRGHAIGCGRRNALTDAGEHELKGVPGSWHLFTAN